MVLALTRYGNIIAHADRVIFVANSLSKREDMLPRPCNA